jgi:hypothetical protein
MTACYVSLRLVSRDHDTKMPLPPDMFGGVDITSQEVNIQRLVDQLRSERKKAYGPKDKETKGKIIDNTEVIVFDESRSENSGQRLATSDADANGEMRIQHDFGTSQSPVDRIGASEIESTGENLTVERRRERTLDTDASGVDIPRVCFLFTPSKTSLFDWYSSDRIG